MRRVAPAWLARVAFILACAAAMTLGREARAQQLDLTRGGPIEITASEGLEWHQNEQQVVARGSARAVRGNVTVTADRLIAYYRKKPPAAGGATGGSAGRPAGATPIAAPVAAPAATAPVPGPTPLAVGIVAGTPSTPAPAGTAQPDRPRRARNQQAPAQQPGLLGGTDSGSNEIYRVEAIGNVHIYTATDQVWGARAVYDMDQAVMLMTGGNLKLTTPNQILTARDSLEYWTQKRMAVARGNAVVVTSDAKRVAADTLVAFSKEDGGSRRGAPAPTTPTGTATGQQPGALQQAGSGKLQRVEAFGQVNIQTATEVVTGDRGIYVADTGLARLGGNVRITRGQNQLNGSDAEVNLNTGVSRLLAGTTGRVAGLVVPNDPSNQTGPDGAPTGVTPTRTPAQGQAAPPRPGRRRQAGPEGTASPGTAPSAGTQP